jgi:hypothetical protein
VALVVMGFILDAQALRRERRGQLCRNNIVHSHDVWLRAERAPRSIKASPAFTPCQVLQAPSRQPHNRSQ